jgi:hypothetical protein
MCVCSAPSATRNSGLSASGKIIKEMPGSVASGTPYIIELLQHTGKLPTIFFNITNNCL